VPESHATDPARPPGLSEADRALLAGDVPDPADAPPAPEPIDWEAAVQRIAAKSRPHREEQQKARERRDRILSEQRAERTRGLNRERSLAQVPPRYRDATVDHPAVAEWVASVIRSGVTGGSSGLVLNGPTGCGKTWQAFGAWHTVAQRTGCRAVAVAVPAFLDSLRPGRTPVAELADVERAELLLLDDLAAERASEWTVELVYRLIDARWNACLPTIITVNAPNVPGHSLRDRLGDRIASRLNGLGRIVTWPPDAPDRRTTPRT
jgi:DNA replication protein DnaC